MYLLAPRAEMDATISNASTSRIAGHPAFVRGLGMGVIERCPKTILHLFKQKLAVSLFARKNMFTLNMSKDLVIHHLFAFVCTVAAANCCASGAMILRVTT